jgi:hypothetical protein
VTDDNMTAASMQAWLERNELMRQAAQRILDNDRTGARVADPSTREWAHHIVRTIRPLQTPMSPGVAA